MPAVYRFMRSSSRHATPRHTTPRNGKARQGTARHSTPRQTTERHACTACRRSARLQARRRRRWQCIVAVCEFMCSSPGVARRGTAWHGTARHACKHQEAGHGGHAPRDMPAVSSAIIGMAYIVMAPRGVQAIIGMAYVVMAPRAMPAVSSASSSLAAAAGIVAVTTTLPADSLSEILLVDT